jgi:hypothetical protein
VHTATGDDRRKAGLNKFDGNTAQLVMTVGLQPGRVTRTGCCGTTDASSAAYNLLQGGLLPTGLVVLTAAPLIAAKFRHVL